MFCEQCGALVPDGMRFCDQCGAPVSDGEAQNMASEAGQYNMQPGPVNNIPPMQQGMYHHGTPPMQQGMVPQGGMQPQGAYNTQKKSPLVPVMIAVVAVLVLGLGGFGVYKNIDKIKELTSKIKKEEPVTEEPPVEEPVEEKPPVEEPPEEKAPVKEETGEETETEEIEKESPGGSDEEDSEDVGSGKTKDERETRDTPAKDAITGGKWARNGSGGHIYNLNGEMQKKCWVEIKGEYYYVDASGYRMSDNWSHDGFYVGEEGLWDESVDRRMDDPEPLAEISYVNQVYKDNTGECKSVVFDGKKGTAALEYQWDDVIYDVTSMGYGTYILTDSSGMLDPMDVVHTLVMSVSEDQSKVMISEYGYTTVLEADGNYNSNGPGKTAENGSDSKGSGSGNITITDIVEMAKTKSGAPNAELDSVDQDGTLNIRLYGNGTQDTWDWYYIDPKTLKGTNITGNVIDLNK
ncbi:MAG: zinc ribbon domain-containing protein [Lachnospiraceae bacterium]|nr:zinc ribbon domain-containing protein [Lachnospiraceae bacterium]